MTEDERTSMTIAIIGCGWFGTPLAERLVGSRHTVFGTTTRHSKLPDLAARGIRPSVLDLNSGTLEVPPADTYVVGIPPTAVQRYREQIDRLADALPASARQVVFCSTTSVYPDEDRTMTEADVPPGHVLRAGDLDEAKHGTPRGDLLAAEGCFARRDNHLILRLAGLYGDHRHPVSYLAGRTGVPKPLAPVNMIHLHDLVAIVYRLVDLGITGEVFNVCSDRHPTRQEFYTAAARARGLPLPVFDGRDTRRGKRVESGKLRRRVGYAFER
jgi:nucleoside-diphosphate-sugar epimerase